jgi:hypothetical protein
MISYLGVVSPQLVTMGQVQLGGEVGDYGEGGSYDPSAGASGQEFEMGDYRG